MKPVTTHDQSELWSTLLQREPGLRIRDEAAERGVSEVELLDANVGHGVARLAGDWRKLLRELPRLGPLLCVTRNDHAVHEQRGSFRRTGFFDGAAGDGFGSGPGIDLRYTLSHWHYGFAVDEKRENGHRRGFHFFDVDGTAVHKVHLLEESHPDPFHELVEAFLCADQEPGILTFALPHRRVLPDSEIDLAAFHRDWQAMSDAHQFTPLLETYGLQREQALRLAPPGSARQVEIRATRPMLEAIASRRVPIMVLVGNRGALQLYSGKIAHLYSCCREGEEWLNICEKAFSFHLRSNAVARAWVLQLPAHDGGAVTSLELYSAQGETIALFFGSRKVGESEHLAWAETLARLPSRLE